METRSFFFQLALVTVFTIGYGVAMFATGQYWVTHQDRVAAIPVSGKWFKSVSALWFNTLIEGILPRYGR